jgi:broad-specificity NMP kinase
MRIVIAGGPRRGKTTRALAIAERTGATVRHTDELVGKLPHGDDSAEVARWFNERGPWVVEGVTAARALRKWMAMHPGKPCDRVVLMRDPVVKLTPGQITQSKGCDTVWREIEPQLAARGVEVVVGVHRES